MGQQLRQWAGGNEFTAAHTRAGAQIQDIIGVPDCVRIVFHDEDRISQVAQALECGQETIIVALMQTDARLVENVQHAYERSPDLRRQPDTLRLTAAERAALAVQGQIAKADVLEKAEPGSNLFDDLKRNFLFKVGKG